ncbi:MAG: sulfite exporter TauE/SafE family protein [Proteobacteria bacterium]|nr:sulfite exporter TauE/SafE family protein [Pseudomonadota bacterium]
MSCECAEVSSADIISILPHDDVSVIISLFLFGLSGSFTHCIGMCGPIAINQMNMRVAMLNQISQDLSEFKRFQCAIAVKYYLGKSFAYAIMAFIGAILSGLMSSFPPFQYIGGMISIFIGFMFCLAAAVIAAKSNINVHNDLMQRIFTHLNNIFESIVRKCNLKISGMDGLLLGMLLGMIPCGFSYAAIASSISTTTDAFTAAFTAFCFGIGTIPGLFLVAYFGAQILTRFKSLFSLFYIASMFFNGYILLKIGIVRILILINS